MTHRPRPWRGVLFVASGLLLTACGEGYGSDRFMSLGTAGTGGIYYVLGGALASHLTELDPARQYTAEVSGGSVENVNRIRARQLDLAMVVAISAYEAYTGGEDVDRPMENLRIVAPLYPNITHLMVRRGANIQSLEDLRGQRISVGPAGSGTEQIARQLLEAVDLSYDDVRVRYLSFAESSSAIQDGAIDAAIISVGYPAAAILEATTTAGARLLPITGEAAARLQERYPYYESGEIPAGVYRGVTEPIPTMAMMNWIVALEELPGEVVERVLEILDQRRAQLIQVHDMASQVDLGSLRRAPIPLHPAARAWLERWEAAGERD
jgi:uncharacterized protein